MIDAPAVSLGELLTLERRPAQVIPDQEYAEIGIYSFGRGIFHKAPRTGIQVGDKDLFTIRQGDFILQITFAWEGAIGLASSAEDGMYGSVRFPTYRVDETRCYPPYLVYYFRTPDGLYQLGKISPGSAGRNRVLSLKHIPEVTVPLPPLPEQRRIVARIDALAGRIEEARGLRREAMAEAEALWGARAREAFLRVGTGNMRPVAEICEVRGGLQKSPAREPRDHPTPYLTVAHVQRNRINTSSDFRFFEVSPEELERWRLESGDLLIIEGNGSASQIGRVALFRGEINNCVHQNHVIRARANRSVALPEYLNAYLNCPLGQDEVQRRSRTTSGLRTLSVGRICEIEIPVPSLAVQESIVTSLEALEATVNDLHDLQAATQRELDALLPSVLAKAFAGEL